MPRLGSSARLSRHSTRLLVCLVLSLSIGKADAQTAFNQRGLPDNREGYAVLPYEQVDPASGNLLVAVTDLSLPGNAGLGLSVTRIYNSKIHPNFESGDYTLEEDSWAGIGWRLHFGRVINPTSSASGATQIEMGDGSRHALYTTTAYAEGWITKDFWRYDKATHTLKLPNGVTYTFGHLAAANGLIGQARYVTEIRDQFNNRIEFSYFGGTGPSGGVSLIRQYTGPAQYRDITFTYEATNKSLATMTFDGRVWTYEQTASGVAGQSLLTKVTPPAGLPWRMEYNSASTGRELSALVAPGGGRIDYTYSTISRLAGGQTQNSRAVTLRAISGWRITPGTWTFTYSTGPAQDQTVVSCACGTTTYKFLGMGTSAAVSAWRAGAMVERKVEDQGTLLELETLSWQQSEAISPDAVPPGIGSSGDPAVYNALLGSRTITRGAQSWATSFEYQTGLGNYNDFGRAWRITEAGDRTRTTTQTFQYGFTPYIIDRVATRAVQVGAATANSTWTYDSTSGLLTQQNLTGFVTTFEHSGLGNTSAAIDALGRRTEFSYNWGVVSEVRTPLVTTTHAVDPSGVVLRTTTGNSTTNLTTDYEYDLALRLRTVRPPNANPITYEYDGLDTEWIRIARGSAQTHHLLDGFGRSVETSDFTLVKTITTRDACGRPTFTSYPYTTGGGTRGVTTTYDALGRVTTVTTPDTPTPGVTSYAYNGIDVTVTDAEGRTRQLNYSAAGGPGDQVLVQVTDPANVVTNYTYNVFDSLTQVNGPGAGLTRTWVYDASNKLLSHTQPESGTTTYNIYDAVGNLTRMTDANGLVLNFTYDTNNRLTFRDAPDPADDLTIVYDPIGRVTSQSTTGVTTTFTYDTAGRLATKTDNITALGSAVYSQYTYDGNDNLTALRYPSGRVITYTYDSTKEYRLTGVLNDGATFANNFQYAHDGGYMTSYQTGSVVHTFAYDGRDRVQRIQGGLSGSPALDLTYAYNRVSNVSWIADVRPGGGPNYGTSFAYDVLDRLTVADGPWGGIGYTYDSRGNRTSRGNASGSTVYTYNQTTQRLTSTSGAFGETTNYAYDAKGQLTSDSRGTYTYSALGMVKTAALTTGPTQEQFTAGYVYDAENFRVSQTVNNVTRFSVRGAGQQVLSEWEAGCGLYWARDNVYAGGRLLGAVRANLTAPSIAFTAASASVTESTTNRNIGVRVTTPGGVPLACSATVSYHVVEGGAAPGTDFTPKSGALKFNPGTASGTVQNIVLPIIGDSIDEPNETVVVKLSATNGSIWGITGAPNSHTLTITDNDAAPTISIGDVSVNEAAGSATFTVTLSAPSGYQVSVAYATANETATAGSDFTTTSGTLIFDPLTVSRTITVPLTNDAIAEPTETFVVNLSNPVNTTINDGQGRATITDNEPYASIDPALPGQYFADGTANTDPSDWYAIFNPHAVAVVARVTYIQPNGYGYVRTYSVPALQRITITPGADASVAGTGDLSVVIQTTDATKPLISEHSSYWGAGLVGGRSSEGASPASTWYFAEGATSPAFWEEFITVVNPTGGPVNIALQLYPTSGAPITQNYTIAQGPGRLKVRINDIAATLEHSTKIVATTPGGSPANVAVERTMYWVQGETPKREGHSSPGSATLDQRWFFAEGGNGFFATHLQIFNPSTTAATIEVFYLHENGQQYSSYFTAPPQARTSWPIPASVPTGGYGMWVWAYNGVGIMVERSMYAGSGWPIGQASQGQPIVGGLLLWRFAEGNVSSTFDTYFLLSNTSTVASTATITYRKTNGTVTTQSVTVPARSRIAVNAKAALGNGPYDFATEVAVTNGVGIIAERAMYWPAGAWLGSHLSMGRPQ